MPTLQQQFKARWLEARQNGHSPEEIIAHLQEQSPTLGPKIKEALDAGFSPAQIGMHLAGMKESGADGTIEAPTRTERFGRGMMDTAQGLKQIYLEQQDPEAAKAYTKQVDQDLARYEAGRGKGAGIDWMRGLGTAAITAPATMLMPYASAPTLLPRMAANAVLGGAVGGAQYVPEGGSRAGNAALGAILAAGLSGAIGGGRGTKTVINPQTGAKETVEVLPGNLFNFAKASLQPFFESGQKKIVGQKLAQAAGGSDMARKVAEALRNSSSKTPGVEYTAGEAANNGGIAALQRAAEAVEPAQFAERGAQNAAARLAALRSIAGDDVAMQAAAEARDAASKPLFDIAKSATVQSTPELDALIGRMPSGIVDKANSLSRMAGEGPVATVGADGATSYTGRGLQYIKMALDDAIDPSAQSGIGSTERALATALKQQYTDEVGKLIPEYAQANAAFASGSVPINQMKIGQALLEKASPALSDYGAIAKENAAKYAEALRSGDKVAAAATGFKGAKMANILTPEQMNVLNGVAEDLGAKVNAQNLGRSVGSDTVQKFAMQNLVDSAGAPWASRIPGASRSIDFLYGGPDDQMKAKLVSALLNPNQAAELMDNAAGSQAKNTLIQLLLDPARKFAPAGAAGMQGAY